MSDGLGSNAASGVLGVVGDWLNAVDGVSSAVGDESNAASGVLGVVGDVLNAADGVSSSAVGGE